MGFKELIYFMLSMIKESSQNALERFFLKTGENNPMTQQSFSEARQKIKWEALQELFELTVEEMYRGEIKRWHGYRVLAIDGSKIALPSDPCLKKYYGTAGTGNGAVTAQGSILYDIYNKVIVDAQIEPMNTDERSLANRHIEKLKSIESFGKEIVIFDRGYPSKELIKGLMEGGIKFLMRVRQKYNLAIDDAPMGDTILRISETENTPITIRILKFKIASGEIETLITNIPEKRYTVKTFKALYFKRWPVETKYDELKNKLEIENFSGLIVENIRQDFYATMCLANIAASLYWEAQEMVEKEQRGKKNKYKYQVISRIMGLNTNVNRLRHPPSTI